MTPANENAVRAACRRCTEEIQQAMRKKPKPNWNETVPPIINKHHKKLKLWELAFWSLSYKQGGLIAASELNRESLYCLTDERPT
ncbi:TPA: hypothetical protein R4139_004884 [Enterobacter hormaechei subsp. hoffmannii]|nr:hypothetical protein [Enterobacter hormaechei]HED3420894.1 hypothetical protein [Enterobacter hormaechei subsp. hoffmannii]HED3493590.1 hypothetical protein [Enterobacter hormaechei subsp. hoffmannii]HED3498291.1 hypothetical protein [Enterobacter hormaechei subsp. hoffmannii]